jgi:hypothetical protein
VNTHVCEKLFSTVHMNRCACPRHMQACGARGAISRHKGLPLTIKLTNLYFTAQPSNWMLRHSTAVVPQCVSESCGAASCNCAATRDQVTVCYRSEQVYPTRCGVRPSHLLLLLLLLLLTIMLPSPPLERGISQSDRSSCWICKMSLHVGLPGRSQSHDNHCNDFSYCCNILAGFIWIR